jgi:hypothetical protein
MKAYIYDIVVVTDPIHNYTKRLKEIFVPSMNYCFNSDKYVFAYNKPRITDYQEIEIDDWTASFLLNYVKVTDTKNQVIEKIFPTLN